MVRVRAATALLLGLVITVAGCGGGDSADDSGGAVSSPLADCAGLAESPPGAAALVPPAPAAAQQTPTPATPAPETGAPETGAPGATASPTPAPPPVTGLPLPELTLPCFTGGQPFALAGLRGPAVVSLWASWCPPCREELPMLQRFADQAAGGVHVVGVVTGDRPAAAASLAEELGITFPALADPDESVRIGLAVAGLPGTAFVDQAGKLMYVHQGPLDEQALARLLTDHLGVVR